MARIARKRHGTQKNYSKSYNARITLENDTLEENEELEDLDINAPLDALIKETIFSEYKEYKNKQKELSSDKEDEEKPAGKKKAGRKACTEPKSVDSVSSVSIYNQIRKKHEKRKDLASIYKKEPVEKLLLDYHCSNIDKKTHDWLRDEIFFRTYFLLPHAIKESYPVTSHVFNDAIQNMSFSVLQAIEKFDPTKGYTFVSYLVGYFKGAFAKTFRDTNVISVPTGRMKILKERQKYVKTESFGSSDEIHTYNGVEYTENGNVGMLDIDFDEDLHNKQLVEWLEEALSREAGVITSDERRVLVLRYGLFGHQKEPYRNIAKLRQRDGLGCAFSRLSQIHAKAVGKLKKFFKDRDISEY